VTVALIDYGGGGNLHSMRKALERAASQAGGQRVETTRDPEQVARADRIVLPGQGAFADCRRGLVELPGILEALEDAVIRRGRPFLGTCIGMQLMATTSREMGEHPGFGWIPGEVVRIAPQPPASGGVWPPGGAWWIPHYGWNNLILDRADHPVLGSLREAHFYFVHSYHLQVADPRHRLAAADYGGAITAAVARDNLVGTQFHPEKSQAAGLRLLTNFLRWAP
jgi:glutamine amidotransferase